MPRNVIRVVLQLVWLMVACDSGGLDSHRGRPPVRVQDPDTQVPDRLIFTNQPGTVIAGVEMHPAVAVTVFDQHGNPMTSARPGFEPVDGGRIAGDVIVTLALVQDAGTLSGTLTSAAMDGVAFFSDLRIETAGWYTLVAEAPGLTRGISNLFNVTLPPARLVFGVPPSSTAPGEPISPAVQVWVVDAQGAVVQTANMAVTLAIETNPAGGTLSGTTIAVVVNGIASFPNLRIDKAGTGYTLTASASDPRGDPGGTGSVTSNPFTVEGFRAVSVGGYACGIGTSGPTYCWGGHFPPTPVLVSGGLAFAAVTVGNPVGCGVTAAGAAYCWGESFFTTPIAVPGGLTFAATSGNCGVTTTGAAYCWGDNGSGQLGNGTFASSSTPVAVAGELTFASVSAGDGFNCGVTTAGAAYCWGYGEYGQLGDGSYASRNTPVAVAGGLTFASVSAGPYHSCGVTTAGAAYCWGDNSVGQLGNGGEGLVDDWGGITSSKPVAVKGAHIFASVSAGGQHSCGVTTEGVTYCWGKNDSGQLGAGSTSETPSTAPVAVTGGHTFAGVSATGYGPWGYGPYGYTCGVTTSGAAYCWGSNVHGELGDGSTTSSGTPVAVAGGLTLTNVSAGTGHNCGVTTAGAAYCWGGNDFGELGNGSTTGSSTPVAVGGGLTFASVSADASRTCGVTTAGAAYCWGESSSSGLFALADEITFAALSAGDGHSCGVTNSGVAYCWGRNDSGELGDGSYARRDTPVVVAGGLTFATVSAGSGHSCGVTTAQAAYCWGDGGFGQLGDGAFASRNTPVAVAGGLTFASVSAGDRHSCGVTTEGAAYCWGDNLLGQLGSPAGLDDWGGSTTPAAVAGGSIFASVSAGANHSCGVTTAGTAYCWGYGEYGQLGDGSYASKNTPVAVVGTAWTPPDGGVGGPAVLTFASVSAGDLRSCGLATTGSAYCWGSGNGSVPMRVPFP